MANAMLDARQEGDSYRRIEVITGRRRRRRWRAEEKALIIAESFETDINISEVARRHGVARGLLTAWRRQFATAARSKLPSFVPVQIDAVESSGGAVSEADHALPAQTGLLEKALPVLPVMPRGIIEIEVSGARVRVESGVELTALCTVLSALRGGR
jgi:transposase